MLWSVPHKKCTEVPHGSEFGNRSTLANGRVFSAKCTKKVEALSFPNEPIGFILQIGLCMLWAIACLSMVSFDYRIAIGLQPRLLRALCYDEF
jgi:hypothetical protein